MLAVCLLLLAVYLLLLAWIPQFSPGSAVDRWLAQTRFGSWTGAMYRLGIFSLAYSPVPRALLSLLGFLLLVRVVEQVTLLRSQPQGLMSQEPSRWAGIFSLLAHTSALALLVGLLIGWQWGWREEGLIALDGGYVPGRAEKPRVYVVHLGPRLTVRATDATGHPVALQRTVFEATHPELVFHLTPLNPETSFAVPEHNLVIRLGIQGTFSFQSPIHLEVFRAPDGERIQETQMDGNSFNLTANGVSLEIIRQPYPLLAAAYDPGLWLKRVGLILGTSSLVGALWPRVQKERVSRLLLAFLTLVVGALFAWSLETTGALREVLPLQTEISILWIVALALWLLRHRKFPNP